MLHNIPLLTNVTKEELEKLMIGMSGRPCASCGHSPAGGAAVFIPNEPWKFIPHAPRPGASRYLVYPICSECSTPENLDKLEEKWESA